MAGIGSIIGSYNINPKRVSSKLSFEIGQIFQAKIISASEFNKDIVLRLSDGWQFPASLLKSMDFIPEGLIKFQVEGFKDGKIQLRIVNDTKEDVKSKDSSIEDLILENNIEVSKDDIDILKKMVKHNMPLTKENISRVKTILDFKHRITVDINEEEIFIGKYVNSKGIDIDSTKGKKIEEVLKGFFNALKSISTDDILTMLENNIDLTEENIKSFVKVFKEDATIYRELKIASKDISLEKSIEQMLDNNDVEVVIKEQLKNKTEEMKNIIKNLMEIEGDLTLETYDKVIQSLKEFCNDFKVFNSVNNNYYYLDIPVNINKDEYECKLLIKDNRKSGKKIDSKNVSLVLSVKTVNIGVVDAYIKVREQNMNVDIKCDEEWIKIFNLGKYKLLNELSMLKYNVFLNIDKRVTEANLVNCSNFFEDSTLNNINIRV
ncbi:hypothetical protein M2651_08530 [Clostridium sp. SYSU_GA19001]|uniref:hypothetical protein n=1 Tax=Clostridium caldaquaticum TaxID=2940653 RepID=UPI002077105F|nr:hypothetical protein [Clostridium caldaquaticum]MCM8711072.1 hypothetical protein [Clostridium caldaquaticum]